MVPDSVGEEIMSDCVICGKEIEGIGHNAESVKNGRCCDNCNMTVVLRERILEALSIERFGVLKEGGVI